MMDDHPDDPMKMLAALTQRIRNPQTTKRNITKRERTKMLAALL
jgi:hypothetical protein